MRKSLFSSLLFIVIASCGVDDYLETENDLASRLFGEPQNLEAIEATLFGTYWQMAIGRSESGFSQPIPIYAEWNMTTSDAYTITDQPTNNYTLNRSDSYWFYNRVLDHFEDGSAENMYSICYTLLSNLNSAVAVIEEPTVELLADITANEDLYNQYVGEVYGLRALNYFMLSQLYGPKYRPNEANDLPSLIVKTRISAEFEDIFDTRSTVQQIYDLMISDLMIAAEHISSTKFVGRLNKAAIYALLARIYLDMNDWENVREYSGLALAEGFDLEDNPLDEFTHTDNSFSNGVIFEMQNSVGHNWEGQRHIEFVSENTPVRFSRWNWIERRTMGRR
ncbi:MAG: RagB/SusD family nutrient uptake outer membrane protein, partial [Ekhidna sp.]|nr:RagB/SusD family nutrient uptake outer membrane protein [Ekhidna sp.]